MTKLSLDCVNVLLALGGRHEGVAGSCTRRDVQQGQAAGANAVDNADTLSAYDLITVRIKGWLWQHES
jgi:hypothetical protein